MGQKGESAEVHPYMHDNKQKRREEALPDLFEKRTSKKRKQKLGFWGKWENKKGRGGGTHSSYFGCARAS